MRSNQLPRRRRSKLPAGTSSERAHVRTDPHGRTLEAAAAEDCQWRRAEYVRLDRTVNRLQQVRNGVMGKLYGITMVLLFGAALGEWVWLLPCLAVWISCGLLWLWQRRLEAARDLLNR